MTDVTGSYRSSLVLGAFAAASFVCPDARAARVEQLVYGVEQRWQYRGEGPAVLQLGFPHGVLVASEHTELLGNLGLCFTADSRGVSALPVALRWNWIPADAVVTPFAGVELGGFLLMRERRRGDSGPASLQQPWVWSVGGAVGLHVAVWRWLGVRAHVDRLWVQDVAGAYTGSIPQSGWAWTVAVTWSQTPPAVDVVRMLLTGDGVPGDL